MIVVLVLSILLTALLIRKLLVWMAFFHWLEFICLTLFVLSLNAHSFNAYSSAYQSLEVTEKYMPYVIVYAHFSLLAPMSFIAVLQLIKRKKPWAFCIIASLTWFFGYLILVFADVHFGVLRIQGSNWIPVTVIATYNTLLIVSSIFFMKLLTHIIKTERGVR